MRILLWTIRNPLIPATGLLFVLGLMALYGEHHSFRVQTASQIAGPADIEFAPPSTDAHRPGLPELVILYAPSCGHCVRWQQDQLGNTIALLVNTGLTRVILRPIPLDTDDLEAATALSCLPPSRRLAALRGLMVSGEPIAPGSAMSEQGCLADPVRQRQILASASALVSAGIRNVPSFLVADTVLVGPHDASELLRVLEANARHGHSRDNGSHANAGTAGAANPNG